MQQKVWLTTEPNAVEINVDDITPTDVINGIYAKYLNYGEQRTTFVHYYQGMYYKFGVETNPNFYQTEQYPTMRKMIEDCSQDKQYEFYTLSGTRIVTEKMLTVGDLKNTDHVGFILSNGEKGYITFSNPEFRSVSVQDWSSEALGNFGNGTHSLNEALGQLLDCSVDVADIYKFTTRKELYQWLSE